MYIEARTATVAECVDVRSLEYAAAYRHIPPSASCLSQASKLGLLSKLEAAGLTLKDVEKLLPLGEPPTNQAIAGNLAFDR